MMEQLQVEIVDKELEEECVRSTPCPIETYIPKFQKLILDRLVKHLEDDDLYYRDINFNNFLVSKKLDFVVPIDWGAPRKEFKKGKWVSVSGVQDVA